MNVKYVPPEDRLELQSNAPCLLVNDRASQWWLRFNNGEFSVGREALNELPKANPKKISFCATATASDSASEIRSMFAAIVREHLRQDIVSYEVIAEELKKRVGLELGPLSIDDIFGYKSMPPQLVCKRCKHSWTPRKQNPRVCPGCNSPYWGEDRIVR